MPKAPVRRGFVRIFNPITKQIDHGAEAADRDERFRKLAYGHCRSGLQVNRVCHSQGLSFLAPMPSDADAMNDGRGAPHRLITLNTFSDGREAAAFLVRSVLLSHYYQSQMPEAQLPTEDLRSETTADQEQTPRYTPSSAAHVVNFHPQDYVEVLYRPDNVPGSIAPHQPPRFVMTLDEAEQAKTLEKQLRRSKNPEDIKKADEMKATMTARMKLKRDRRWAPPTLSVEDLRWALTGAGFDQIQNAFLNEMQAKEQQLRNDGGFLASEQQRRRQQQQQHGGARAWTKRKADAELPPAVPPQKRPRVTSAAPPPPSMPEPQNELYNSSSVSELLGVASTRQTPWTTTTPSTRTQPAPPIPAPHPRLPPPLHARDIEAVSLLASFHQQQQPQPSSVGTPALGVFDAPPLFHGIDAFASNSQLQQQHGYIEDISASEDDSGYPVDPDVPASPNLLTPRAEARIQQHANIHAAIDDAKLYQLRAPSARGKKYRAVADLQHNADILERVNAYGLQSQPPQPMTVISQAQFQIHFTPLKSFVAPPPPPPAKVSSSAASVNSRIAPQSRKHRPPPRLVKPIAIALDSSDIGATLTQHVHQ